MDRQLALMPGRCLPPLQHLLFLLSLCAPVLLHAAEEDFTDGIGHYQKSRWKLAAESFQKFLKDGGDQPNAERARYFLGLTYINLEDHKQARDQLRSFVAKHPTSKNATAAQFWIGQCSYLLRDNAAAAKELLAFVQKVPNDPLAERALAYLGEAELELNQAELAAKHLSEALKKNDKGATAEDTKYFLARAYEKLRKLDQARPLFDEVAASKTASHAVDAQLKIGKLEFDAGDYQKSAAAYAAVAERFPASDKVPLAQLNQAFAQYELGQHPAALETFDKVLSDARFGDEARYWKGQSLKALGDWAKAGETFQAGFELKKGTPAGERHLYQWALCEHRRNALPSAQDLYLQVVEAYPQGNLADDSLHAAGEVALLSGKTEEAQALVAKFDQQYPSSPLKPAHDILKGRLAFALAKPGVEGDPQRDAAVATLEALGKGTDATSLQARYYLGSALQQRASLPGRSPADAQQDHQRVLEVTAPVAEAVEKDATLRSLAGVFVLRGVSALSIGKRLPADMMPARMQQFTSALQSASRYLALAETGDLADQALAVKVIAQGHKGDLPSALADLEDLRSNAAASRATDEAMLELADIAFASDLPLAEKLYAELATLPVARLNPRVLLELGHTRWKQKNQRGAAEAFRRLASEFPEDPNAVEAAYQQGKMLEELGKSEDALKMYQATFAKYAPREFAYFAGYAAGAVLARLQRPDEAEKAFAATVEKYPARKDLDRLYFVWAGMNYDFKRYARGDELYRQLFTQFPTSPYADDARLSVAESDLVADPPRFDAARQQFTALAADPQVEPRLQERALYQLTQIEIETKRWEELRKVCGQLIDRFPDGLYRWDARFHQAEADFQTQAIPEAHDHLVKLRDDLVALRKKLGNGDMPEIKPGGDPADTGSGTVSEDGGDPARKVWYPRVWVMLGETQFRLKKYAEVEVTVADFKSLLPKSDHTYYLDEVLGRTFKAQARFEDARQAFGRVVADTNGRLTETAAKSQFHLAETYLLEKDYKHALDEYLKVEIRYKFPEWQGASLLQAAACYEALNEWKDAVKTYEDLLQQFPEHAYAPQAKERLVGARKRAGL